MSTDPPTLPGQITQMIEHFKDAAGVTDLGPKNTHTSWHRPGSRAKALCRKDFGCKECPLWTDQARPFTANCRADRVTYEELEQAFKSYATYAIWAEAKGLPVLEEPPCSE